MFRGGRELGFWNWQEKSGILLTAYGRKCHGNYFKMTEITLSRSRSHMGLSFVRMKSLIACDGVLAPLKLSLAFRNDLHDSMRQAAEFNHCSSSPSKLKAKKKKKKRG